MESIKLTYSEELAKKSATTFWLRQLSPVAILLVIGLVALFFYRFSQGSQYFALACVLSVLVLGLIFLAVNYVFSVRRIIACLNWSAQGPVVLEMDECCLKVCARYEQKTLQWSHVENLWRHEQVWLLPLSSNRYLSIPTRSLGKTGCDYMLKRLAEHGVRAH